MKNVKTLLIFMITTTLLLASEQRVNSLGGNVGYWADDDNSWTAFPHTINNSNLAQVSGLGSDENHNAIVRWGDGTKWGFSWNQENDNDMINLQWGNGSMGATFGLEMTSSDNGETGDGNATSGMGISASWGQAMGFGEIGVGFMTSSEDDGVAGTKDDPSTMGLEVNLRRAQSLWLFDNMLVNFAYESDNEDCMGNCTDNNASAVTEMVLATSLFTHIDIADGTTGLVAMGFGYLSAAGGMMKDATASYIVLPHYTFAVESAMTDWATCRVGLETGYVVNSSMNSGETGAKDQTWQGGMGTDFSVGLGFNYGSFNLDVDVTEELFTDPVHHITGFEGIAPDGATATLTYVW